ncbi:hypothetical protein SteCoe_33765 [Stentor coeruleus]|uniref:Uncharacterized protein n=1 Tax=Stentor coeruleus TaxID=5963 RepID=A0A1R2AW70_9CILI|nr:hypothetical protein SteCoe_33765 [Stentor coeruleus]
MISQINSNSESEPDECDSILVNEDLLERIVSGLSCSISKTALDLVNSGIEIYDPFTICQPFETPKIFQLSKAPKAISLRSKSTRSLSIRSRSVPNFVKSFKIVLEKVEMDDKRKNKNLNILEDLNKSHSKSRLTPINERPRKKNSHFSKKHQVLQDVYNIKNRQSYKSIRTTSKESSSPKIYTKISKYTSFNFNKYT